MAATIMTVLAVGVGLVLMLIKAVFSLMMSGVEKVNNTRPIKYIARVGEYCVDEAQEKAYKKWKARHGGRTPSPIKF